MNITFADRVERVSPSATIAIGNKASSLKADGVDVVDLSVGEPDFDTPEKIKEAARDALAAGKTGYTPSNGIPALREAIADTLARDGLDFYGPENVVVTPGGKQALFEIFQALIDDGDEVVLFDPAWVSYEAMTKLAGGSLTRIDTATHDFALEPALDELAEAVSEETKLLVLNSPGNPHGAVYSDRALEGVRDLAVEHDILVISDEIYGKITYDGVTATSIGTLEGMADRTITVNGFSKAYAMTGWRLGYFAAPDAIVEQAAKVHSHSVSCATNFVQHAGVTALREVDEEVAEMVDAFAQRREFLLSAFDERGVDVVEPQGAFYMMVPVDEDDAAWCDAAISDAHVATVPGSAFGTHGYARISYANSLERLGEALERLDEHDLL